MVKPKRYYPKKYQQNIIKLNSMNYETQCKFEKYFISLNWHLERLCSASKPLNIFFKVSNKDGKFDGVGAEVEGTKTD